MEIMDASIVGLITSAICIFLLWKFLSCAVFPLLGNIILGGLLYYVINLLHIVHMPWRTWYKPWYSWLCSSACTS